MSFAFVFVTSSGPSGSSQPTDRPRCRDNQRAIWTWWVSPSRGGDMVGKIQAFSPCLCFFFFFFVFIKCSTVSCGKVGAK